MFGFFAAYAVVPYSAMPTLLAMEVEPVAQQDEQEMILHNGYASDSIIQDYVNYAYNLWWIDFVKLIECENGRRDPTVVSSTRDYWLCQLNYRYNKKFINSPDFADPYKQLDYCYEKFKINPKLRYWPTRKVRGRKCIDYVSNRFDTVQVPVVKDLKV